MLAHAPTVRGNHDLHFKELRLKGRQRVDIVLQLISQVRAAAWTVVKDRDPTMLQVVQVLAFGELPVELPGNRSVRRAVMWPGGRWVGLIRHVIAGQDVAPRALVRHRLPRDRAYRLRHKREMRASSRQAEKCSCDQDRNHDDGTAGPGQEPVPTLQGQLLARFAGSCVRRSLLIWWRFLDILRAAGATSCR